MSNNSEISSDRYKYTHLQHPRSIRLLTITNELIANKGFGDPRVYFMTLLVEVSVDDPPPYVALSYSWEGQDRDREFFIYDVSGNTKRLMITKNCEDAINRFRKGLNGSFFDSIGSLRTSTGTKFMALWIDAICIDQENLEERNQQVRIMVDIYTRAHIMSIWLGPGTPESKKVFKFVFRWQIFQIFQRKLSSFGLRLPWAIRYSMLSIRKCPSHRKTIASCCDNDIGRRSYWSRIWTLQEIASAKSERIVMYCGDSHPVIYYLFHEALGGITSNMFSVHTSAHLLAWTRKYSESWKSPMSTHSRMMIALTKRATYPRDKIFALRALFSDVLEAIPVDYSVAVGELYAMATKAIVEYNKSLDFLKHLDGNSVWTDGPSWAVDFSSPVIFQIYISGYQNHRHSASRVSAPNYKFIGTDSLLLHGRLVDVVHVCYKALPGTLRAHMASMQDDNYINTITVIHSLLSGIYGIQEWIEQYWLSTGATGKPPPEVLLKFAKLLSSSEARAVDDFDELQRLINKIMYKGLWGLQYSDSLNTNDSLRWPFSPSEFSEHVGKLTLEDFMLEAETMFLAIYSLLCVYNGHRFFTTKEGRLGLGPSKTMVGDKVMLFAGFSLPMLMRTDGEKNKLIGRSYVLGFIKGEAWPDDNSQLQGYEIW